MYLHYGSDGPEDRAFEGKGGEMRGVFGID